MKRWIDTGKTFGNSRIFAKGNERKLVDKDGKYSDFYYEYREDHSKNERFEGGT